jgi:anti-anti-sigma regulatory factor/two-component sensor histidine kinase
LKEGQTMLSSNGKDIAANEADVTLDRLASIGQIAAGIAHEVKNPLTAVKGFLQLLKAESSHRYIDFAYSELENALTTLENLLHISKPDLENEPIDSINLCEELEALLFLFQERSYQIQIDKQFHDQDIHIYGKRNQLKKAFFNLLKNAFEAIPDQGKITIKHFLSNDQVVITLADTGVGIPRDKIHLLWTPFYTSKPDGTGMGLTQVFSAIHEHAGQIHVKSQEGVGTEFTIRFPYQEMNDVGVVPLHVSYTEDQDFSQFYTDNQEMFRELLERRGSKLLQAVQEASSLDSSYILQSAHTVVSLLNERNEHGLIIHGKEHGRNWAKNQLDLILKLEWIQMLRKLYWDFLFNYHSRIEIDTIQFFHLERRVNYNLDSYLKHFSSSYSEYKDELLLSQREVIDDLSVPLIPLSAHTAMLLIAGAIDDRRIRRLQEDVWEQIYQLKLQRMVIDFSGIAAIDGAMIEQLFKLVNGIGIQGCHAILTGIRPEVTGRLLELDFAFHHKVETQTTLEEALRELYGERLP